MIVEKVAEAIGSAAAARAAARGGSIWRHEETGELRRVLYHAEYRATGEPVVVCTDQHLSFRQWVIPAAEFLDGRFTEVKP